MPGELTIASAIEEIEACGFECEAGSIKNSAAWQYLKAQMTITPHLTTSSTLSSAVDHPAHYGGADNPYEAIKVIEAWGLDFNLGNTVKYIARAEYKQLPIQDLQKARWYLDREIANRTEALNASLKI